MVSYVYTNKKHCNLPEQIIEFSWTDGIFETGAYGVPSKSQNPTVLGQVSNVQTLAGHDVGTIYLAPQTTLHFHTVLKTKYSFSHWIFYSLLK